MDLENIINLIASICGLSLLAGFSILKPCKKSNIILITIGSLAFIFATWNMILGNQRHQRLLDKGYKYISNGYYEVKGEVIFKGN